MIAIKNPSPDLSSIHSILYQSFSVTSLLCFLYIMLQPAKCLAHITVLTVPDICVGIDRFHEFSSQKKTREIALFFEML
jgi:hypothetical protein